MSAAVAGFLALTALAAPPADPSLLFSHREHFTDRRKAQCTTCHTEGEAADVERPAKQDHASCNSEKCHAAEFFTAKMGETRLCLVCHISKDWKDLEKRRANIREFPRGRSRDAQNDGGDRTYLDDWDFYAEFSHKTHLAKGGPIKKKTADDGCLFCHQISVTAAGKPVVKRPGHEHCVSCHNGKEEKPATTMKDCASCHLYRRSERGQLVRTGPVAKKKIGRVTGRFSHESHRLDKRKSEATPTSCGACHDLVVKADTLGEIETTAGQRTMESSCKACHDGRQRTAGGKIIFDITSQCTLCHQPNFLDELERMPRSHR